MSDSISSLLPAARASAVQLALQKTFGTTVADITLLAGGLSAAAVYKLSIKGSFYVLKLEPPSALSDHTLSNNLQLAAAAGIAPQVYYLDTANGISITDFIAPKPLRTVFTPDQLVQKLATTIKCIHAVPCHAAGRELITVVDGLVQQFKARNILSGALLDECLGHYSTIKSKYPWKDTEKVFSHNDLNPNNILCDGEKIWVIDWDAAFPNDKYVDLASAANFFVHDEVREHIFLKAYFGKEPDDYKTARFYLMRQICRIVYAMLMFELAAQGKPANYAHPQEMEGIDLKTFGALMESGKISLAGYEGQLMYGKALINEALYQMRSPRFATSLTAMTTQSKQATARFGKA